MTVRMKETTYNEEDQHTFDQLVMGQAYRRVGNGDIMICTDEATLMTLPRCVIMGRDHFNSGARWVPITLEIGVVE